MRTFFKSRLFKTVCSIICIFVALTVIFGTVGYRIAPHSALVSTIISPFQKASGFVSNSVSNFFDSVNRAKILEKENNELREELRTMREKVVNHDQYQAENEFYVGFLDIKKKNPDFSFQPASLVSFDTSDVYKTFTIDCGSAEGVSRFDPVITADGLVGYISEAGLTTSTVVTILNPNLSVGAIDTRTKETGIISGDTELVKSDKCILSHVGHNSHIALGDYIVSSGTGGIFPADLMIGTVSQIGNSSQNVSLYGAIEPSVNFSSLSKVMVITSFEGQGSVK